MMLVLKICFKCATSVRFWENNGWINPIDPYCWFQLCFRYWLGRIAIWKGTASRFKGELIKMIKDVNGRFDDYSI